MTGPFDKKDDEFDWDAELSKWEAAFEPEMAKEKKEDARASAGAVTAAPPLAETPAAPPPRSPSARPPAPPPGLSPPRPPVAPPRPAPSASRVPAPTASRSPEPPRVSPPAPPVAAPPAPPSAPRVPAPGQHGLIDFTAPSEEEEPTHVRDVPTVLRATTTPPPERPSRPSRAGLGQLFGRAEPPSSRNRLSTRPAEEELVRALPDLKQAETQDDEDNEPTRVGEVREAIESLRRPQPSSVPPPPPSSPEIYAPLQRAHDPDVETGVVDVRAIELPKMPVAPPAPASDSGPALAVGEEEIPLDLAEAPEESAEPAVDPMRVRAEWLEDEARRMQNAQDRARALLTVSELRAQLGDREDALRLACEARDQAPQLPLAHAQARGLLDRGDLAGLIDAVDRSRKFPSTAEASVHEALLAAIAHHVRGNDDEMRRRWTDASQVGLEDARVLVGSVALALARGDVPATNITIPDREEMAPLREAVNGVRRTRGLDAPNATTPWVDDSLRRARGARVG